MTIEDNDVEKMESSCEIMNWKEKEDGRSERKEKNGRIREKETEERDREM